LESGGQRLCSRPFKQARGQIDSQYRTVLSDGFRRWQCRGAGPTANIEHFSANRQAETVYGPPANSLPKTQRLVVKMVSRRIISRRGFLLCLPQRVFQLALDPSSGPEQHQYTSLGRWAECPPRAASGHYDLFQTTGAG